MGDVDTQLFFNHIKFITTATLQGLLEFLATSSSVGSPGSVPHPKELHKQYIAKTFFQVKTPVSIFLSAAAGLWRNHKSSSTFDPVKEFPGSSQDISPCSYCHRLEPWELPLWSLSAETTGDPSLQLPQMELHEMHIEKQNSRQNYLRYILMAFL